ncbi:MAG: ATP-binding cassette domain-containing protein [Lentisphaerae bacterium]|nr:ATP-binding cassette domain-containing protein [Lentisphaerota bacterium]
MGDYIIEAKGICYRYPCGKDALMGLDLRVERGSKLAVLGANGSGKTTLFLCLNGILRPQSGALCVQGRPVSYARRDLLEWRRRVGMVFQEPDDQVVAGTVMQDIAFGPLNLGLSHEEARMRATDVLHSLQIEHFRDRPTHELSHGERKLVAIAGVLAMRPELVILDEPTAGVDPAGAEQVLEVLETIHRQGTTLVISTHDMDMAYEWADGAAILVGGQTWCQGPVTDVFADRAALRGARLQSPWLLEVARGLQAKGIVTDGAQTIRSRGRLLEMLAGAREA